MAMNKKEQAAFKELQDRVALLSAMALPPVGKPKQVELETIYSNVQHGWCYNFHRFKNGEPVESCVVEAWRKEYARLCYFRDRELTKHLPDLGHLYATRDDAILALYFEFMEHVGQRLVLIRAALLKSESGECVRKAKVSG